MSHRFYRTVEDDVADLTPDAPGTAPKRANLPQWRGASSRRRRAAPYLDVMSVSSSQHVTAAEACRGPHSQLLIEPLPVPDAKHTGLRLRQRKANSFFHANGAKSRSLRGQVSDTLGRAAARRNRSTAATLTPRTPAGRRHPSAARRSGCPLRHSAPWQARRPASAACGRQIARSTRTPSLCSQTCARTPCTWRNSSGWPTAKTRARRRQSARTTVTK